jgi:hypothetical protein
MLVLKEGEVCPYSARCPYRINALGDPCHGTLSTRNNTFTCEFVVGGEIKEGQTRVPGDKTGKMKVILG